MLVQLLGYLASTVLAIRLIPQAYRCYKKKNAKGFDKKMLYLWLVGEILMIAYIILSVGVNIPLLLYYTSTILLLFVILKYKWWPHFDDERDVE